MPCDPKREKIIVFFIGRCEATLAAKLKDVRQNWMSSYEKQKRKGPLSIVGPCLALCCEEYDLIRKRGKFKIKLEAPWQRGSQVRCFYQEASS